MVDKLQELRELYFAQESGNWEKIEEMAKSNHDLAKDAKRMLIQHDSVYTLKLTSRQADVVIRALDLYVRLGIGQLNALVEELQHLFNFRFSINAIDGFRHAITACKRALFGFEENASWGIGNNNVPEKAHIAYDVECVLRQCVAKNEGHNTASVWLHDPLKYSKEPLPEILVERKSEQS